MSGRTFAPGIYRNLIVDGPYLTRRCYEANGLHSMLSSPIMLLLELEEAFAPCNIYICWEQRNGRGNTVRHDIDPGYKAQRSKPAEEYLQGVEDLSNAHGPLQSLGWRCAWPKPGTGEADDVAATLCWKQLGPHLLWSADKDWLQLVREGPCEAHMIRASPGKDGQRYCPATLRALTGLDAAGWSALLTLAGDTSDGIPGLRLIGEKRARAMIEAVPDILQLLLAGEADAVRRAGEACDPTVGRYIAQACDEISMLQHCWDLVRLRRIEMDVEARGWHPADAIAWCEAHDFGFVARAIQQREDRLAVPDGEF